MKRHEQVALAIFIAGIAVWFNAMLRHNCYLSAGPDSSGYCNEAKLIASGRMMRESTLLRALNLPPEMIYVTTPLGFGIVSKPYFMVPSYPAGQPFHQVLFAAIGGWKKAPFLVGPVLALLAVLATVWVGREFGLPLVYALAGGAMMAMLPVFIVHGLQSASDDVAGFYGVLPIALALWSARSGRGAIPAILAGVAFAVGVWVRPTNFLMALPLAFALRWQWRRLIPAAAAALPLGLALAWWQTVLYGSPFRTGYGSLWDVITRWPVCAPQHLESLTMMFTPLVVIAAPFVFVSRGVSREHRVLLAVWFGIFMLFYSFYGWCDGWMSLRFLLPALPAVIVAFLMVVRSCGELVGEHSDPRFAATVAVLVVVSLLWVMKRSQKELGVFFIEKIDSVYPESVRFAEARLPKNAIVCSGLLSGAFLYYADRETIRWDEVVRAGRLPVVRAAARKAGLQWYAVESAIETSPQEFDAWLPSRWTPVAMDRDVTLWRLEEVDSKR